MPEIVQSCPVLTQLSLESPPSLSLLSAPELPQSVREQVQQENQEQLPFPVYSGGCCKVLGPLSLCTEEQKLCLGICKTQNQG